MIFIVGCGWDVGETFSSCRHARPVVVLGDNQSPFKTIISTHKKVKSEPMQRTRLSADQKKKEMKIKTRRLRKKKTQAKFNASRKEKLVYILKNEKKETCEKCNKKEKQKKLEELFFAAWHAKPNAVKSKDIHKRSSRKGTRKSCVLRGKKEQQKLEDAAQRTRYFFCVASACPAEQGTAHLVS